ncbi:MAG: hypothetical protein ACXWP4_08130 [Polyangiales bacterium]
MRKIPPYAAHVAFHRLVSIACPTCHARRWAELVPATFPVPLDRWAGMTARCLQCGALGVDRSTWVSP